MICHLTVLLIITKKKWGIWLDGKPIIKPSDLKNDNYAIIIASEYQAEIELQLKDMGLLENVILKEDLLLPKVMKQLEQLKREHCYSVIPLNDSRTIILDLSEGVQLDGIETWSYVVAGLLREQNLPIEIWAKKTEMEPPEKIKQLFHYYAFKYEKFSENVAELAEKLIKKAPCSVIINKQTQLMYAAMLAKEIGPEGAITIVSIIHNDNVALYHRQKRLEAYTDHICCVSSCIMKKLIEEYGVDQMKVSYKESPLAVPETLLERQYTEDISCSIQIGYAARIVKFQKRADLFLPLLLELERRRCNYHLWIAGDGAYLSTLQQQIKENNLNHRVSFLGFIEHTAIPEFWSNKDIFLSLSDFEGSGISALEAMHQGVIPVETKVSGVEEFVVLGEKWILC